MRKKSEQELAARISYIERARSRLPMLREGVVLVLGQGLAQDRGTAYWWGAWEGRDSSRRCTWLVWCSSGSSHHCFCCLFRRAWGWGEACAPRCAWGRAGQAGARLFLAGQIRRHTPPPPLHALLDKWQEQQWELPDQHQTSHAQSQEPF